MERNHRFDVMPSLWRRQRKRPNPDSRYDELACVGPTAFATFARMAGAHQFSVVFADGDDLVRHVMTEVLLHEGIDVHACDSGAEALKLCRQLKPDAVLLDLNMPDMDGLETARALRADPNTESLRLVALTGRGTWELRDKVIQAGFDEFVVKPISGPDLVRVLKKQGID